MNAQPVSAALGLVLLYLSAGVFAEPAVIAEYAGTRGTSTRPFTAEGASEVHWTSNGAYLSVRLMNLDGERIDVAVSASDPGEGSWFYPQGGT